MPAQPRWQSLVASLCCRHEIKISGGNKRPIRSNAEATPFTVIRDTEHIREPLMSLPLRDYVETSEPNLSRICVIKPHPKISWIVLQRLFYGSFDCCIDAGTILGHDAAPPSAFGASAGPILLIVTPSTPLSFAPPICCPLRRCRAIGTCSPPGTGCAIPAIRGNSLRVRRS